MFVSLGQRCDVAWQIRRRFNIDTTSPFDWLVTPLPAVTRLINEGFSKITNNLVEAEYADNHWTIYNTDYRIHLHHEFPRAENGTMAENWRDHIPKVAEKFNFLGERFFNTMRNADSVIFIRNGGDLEMPREKPIPTTESDYIAILEALETITTNFKKLVLLNCSDVPDHSHIMSAILHPPTIEEMPNQSNKWRGSTINYDNLFDSLADESK